MDLMTEKLNSSGIKTTLTLVMAELFRCSYEYAYPCSFEINKQSKICFRNEKESATFGNKIFELHSEMVGKLTWTKYSAKKSRAAVNSSFKLIYHEYDYFYIKIITLQQLPFIIQHYNQHCVNDAYIAISLPGGGFEDFILFHCSFDSRYKKYEYRAYTFLPFGTKLLKQRLKECSITTTVHVKQRLKRFYWKKDLFGDLKKALLSINQDREGGEENYLIFKKRFIRYVDKMGMYACPDNVEFTSEPPLVTKKRDGGEEDSVSILRGYCTFFCWPINRMLGSCSKANRKIQQSPDEMMRSCRNS